MFENLDTIDWSALTACDGPATQIPDWLRDAMGNDASKHAPAFQRLHDALYHQGDRFPASAAAIPFLMEIALSPNALHRDTALEIVARLVGGPCTIRDGFGLSDGAHTIFGVFELPPGAGDRETIEVWRTCYNAARGYVASLLNLAEEGPENVRRVAPYVLATLRAERGAIVPRLQSMFARERVDHVRAVQVFAVGMVAPQRVGDFLLDVVQSDRSHLVRLVAALVFGWTTPQRVPDVIVDQLLEGLRASCGELGGEVEDLGASPGDIQAQYGELPFGFEGLTGDIGHVLARAGGPRAPRRALSLLVRALEKSDGVTLIGIVQGILRVGLAESTTSEADCRRVCAAKAALFYCHAVWRMPQVTNLFAMRGMPESRDEFGSSIGLSVENYSEGKRALNTGFNLGREGRLDEALEKFREAVVLLPHDPLAAANVVWALWALERNHDGLAECEIALAVFERYAELYWYHAFFLLAHEQRVQAVDSCTRGLADGNQSSPRTKASLRFLRARAYARLSKPEQAIADLRQCLSLDASYAADIEKEEDFAELRGHKDYRLLLGKYAPVPN